MSEVLSIKSIKKKYFTAISHVKGRRCWLMLLVRTVRKHIFPHDVRCLLDLIPPDRSVIVKSVNGWLSSQTQRDVLLLLFDDTESVFELDLVLERTSCSNTFLPILNHSLLLVILKSVTWTHSCSRLLSCLTIGMSIYLLSIQSAPYKASNGKRTLAVCAAKLGLDTYTSQLVEERTSTCWLQM